MQKLQDSWSKFESWLLDPPLKALSKPELISRRILRIMYAVVRDLANGQISLHAMSLVYTTILSIVPLLALSFSVLKAFNVQDKFTPMLASFLEPMGEKGLEIQLNILSFVDNVKVGVLGIVGFVLLFYTAISLVQKIERAFNTIWLAPQLRSIGNRFSQYLSVILVGPVLIVAAISVTASTMNSSLIQTLAEIEPFGSLIIMLTKLMPFLMIIIAFTFFYAMMPNTKVKFTSALWGGIVGGSAWQASSLIFTAFVVNSTNYDAIYSGFAVGILLLIWLYMNWLILLMGSSIAFYHQHGNNITRNANFEASPVLLEKVGLEVMVRVAECFEQGAGPISQTRLEQRKFLPPALTRQVINKLLEAGLVIVAGADSDCLVPGKSTDQITVADILNALRHDQSHLYKKLNFAPSLERLSEDYQSNIDNQFGQILLRDLINQQQK
ncbi:YhjD/YihY/BrkB family envelope integrity protein [Paraglaciecola sp. 25GB23A]|uniref:YihY/virulence factor BrkB family protein n=1 Tax=Paraglaciecola sp. 25GB23A TaxID=3156068 RepID=UPI0032B015BC